MIKSKNLAIVLSVFFLLSFVSESFAQRTSSRSSRSTRNQDRTAEKLGFKDKLAYDLHLGSINFSNSGFFLSGKIGAGYKVIDRLSFGPGLKFFYQYINFDQRINPGLEDISEFTFGPYGFARFRIADQFYAKAEYTSFRIKNADNLNFPSVGIGYCSGFGKWKYGIEVLIPTTNQARDSYTILEYTFSFLYNL